MTKISKQTSVWGQKSNASISASFTPQLDETTCGCLITDLLHDYEAQAARLWMKAWQMVAMGIIKMFELESSKIVE